MSLGITHLVHHLCLYRLRPSDRSTLGDANLLSRFMHTLSQFYQGLPQLYPPPTFKRYYFPTPSASMSAKFWPQLTHLHHPCLLTEFVPVYVDFLQKYQHLKWRFDTHDLDELRSILSSREERYLSKQDCLSAHIVAVLNRHTSEPVRTIANVSDVSQFAYLTWVPS